jgi:thioredoxin-like negative regulator of GroEL
MNEIKYITDNYFTNDYLSIAALVVLECLTNKASGQIMEPILKRLQSNFQVSIIHLRIDLNSNPATQQQFQIYRTPSYLIFHNGKLIERISGFTSFNQLYSVLNNVLKQLKKQNHEII